MITGIIIGFGCGLTLATLTFGWQLIRANQRAQNNGGEIIDLLRRRTEAAEKMAYFTEIGNYQ